MRDGKVCLTEGVLISDLWPALLLARDLCILGWTLQCSPLFWWESHFFKRWVGFSVWQLFTSYGVLFSIKNNAQTSRLYLLPVFKYNYQRQCEMLPKPVYRLTSLILSGTIFYLKSLFCGILMSEILMRKSALKNGIIPQKSKWLASLNLVCATSKGSDLTSLRIRTVWSEPLLVAWVFYDC